MSLIGSLEDLSLGDILQIISLSQKSGVLALRSGQGEGRICFRAGLVCAAVTKSGPRDLRGVLVGGGFVPSADFDAAGAAAGEAESVEDLLVAAGAIERERLDALKREAVEAAVVEMFQWTSGEFSFDVRDRVEPDDPRIVLEAGVNAQYLAMEAARCGDELDRGELDEADEDMSAQEMFAAASAPEEAPPAPTVVARAIGGDQTETYEVGAESADEGAESADAGAESLGDEPVAGARATAAPDDDATMREIAVGVVADAAVAASEQRDASAPQAPSTAPEADFDPSRPVVVIDADLPALEWVKAALSDSFERVHIFQRSDLALTRIRQYLARAIAPIVVLSPDTPADRLSGIRDAADFVRRLKQQAARTRVVWIQEDGGDVIETVAPADAIAIRPAGHHLRSAAGRSAAASLAGPFEALVRAVGAGVAPAGARSTNEVPDADLEELKHATQCLRDASTRGEVLPLVIDFAARRFRRVAMWMLRDGVAVGMAQRGLELCGGPDDRALRGVEIPVQRSGWLSRLLEVRRPVSGPPRTDGDRELALALGDRLPEHAYLAPIESGGRVVAVVYGDDLPGGAAPSDTSTLEVVLHHAGLALDRAALERALAEAETAR